MFGISKKGSSEASSSRGRRSLPRSADTQASARDALGDPAVPPLQPQLRRERPRIHVHHRRHRLVDVRHHRLDLPARRGDVRPWRGAGSDGPDRRRGRRPSGPAELDRRIAGRQHGRRRYRWHHRGDGQRRDLAPLPPRRALWGSRRSAHADPAGVPLRHRGEAGHRERHGDQPIDGQRDPPERPGPRGAVDRAGRRAGRLFPGDGRLRGLDVHRQVPGAATGAAAATGQGDAVRDHETGVRLRAAGQGNFLGTDGAGDGHRRRPALPRADAGLRHRPHEPRPARVRPAAHHGRRRGRWRGA